MNTLTKLIIGVMVGAGAWRALGPDRQQREKRWRRWSVHYL